MAAHAPPEKVVERIDEQFRKLKAFTGTTEGDRGGGGAGGHVPLNIFKTIKSWYEKCLVPKQYRVTNAPPQSQSCSAVPDLIEALCLPGGDKEEIRLPILICLSFSIIY